MLPRRAERGRDRGRRAAPPPLLDRGDGADEPRRRATCATMGCGRRPRCSRRCSLAQTDGGDAGSTAWCAPRGKRRRCARLRHRSSSWSRRASAWPEARRTTRRGSSRPRPRSPTAPTISSSGVRSRRPADPVAALCRHQRRRSARTAHEDHDHRNRLRRPRHRRLPRRSRQRRRCASTSTRARSTMLKRGGDPDLRAGARGAGPPQRRRGPAALHHRRRRRRRARRAAVHRRRHAARRGRLGRPAVRARRRRDIGRRMTESKVVVDKSTVPVGTADQVRAAIAEELAAPRREHRRSPWSRTRSSSRRAPRSTTS